MIKFIKTFFGIEATAKNIRGKKSCGSQDASGASNKYWRKDPNSISNDSLN